EADHAGAAAQIPVEVVATPDSPPDAALPADPGLDSSADPGLDSDAPPASDAAPAATSEEQ
ncbi:MAG TPA: hypothetical protein VK988_14275, partial [Acidimicrobiales bacterium]|nr:hypothetical protein [Acidimicrobiales bacterium]